MTDAETRELLADALTCIDRAAAGCRTTKTLRPVTPGECNCVACDIDAALAERQDSATDVVEWHGAEAATQTATLPKGEVWVYPAASVNYFWCVRRIVNGQERRDVGSAMTVAEAKSAAIAAARGVK